MAAHGQQVLNLGYALALPLGELLNKVKLRGRCRWRKGHRRSDKLPSQKMIFAVAARAALMRSAGAQQTCVPMRPPET